MLPLYRTSPHLDNPPPSGYNKRKDHVKGSVRMPLYLTSSPCDDDVPAGCNLPCIFFARNGFVDNLRRHVRPGLRFLAIAAWKDDHARNDEMAETFAS